MQLAVVKGRATSTVKHASLASSKLLVCQMIGIDGQAEGDPVLALDQLGAGRGDRVILTSDSEGLGRLVNSDTCPARWWTMGIVDG